MDDTPNLRRAVRGLMIDPTDRVLLAQLRFPAGFAVDSGESWTGWVLPGGGVEAGEDLVEALRRELHEETGVAEAFVGPAIMDRRHIRPGMIPGYDGQHETIYLVPCRAFDPAPGLDPEALAAEGFVSIRWWTADEIAASDESIRPENLNDLLAAVLEHGAPAEPIRLEVKESIDPSAM